MSQELVEGIVDLCAEGIYATSGQVFAWAGRDALDVVITGDGPTSFSDHSDVMEVFCLTKPLVAAAAVIAATEAGVDVFSPLCRVLERAAHLDDHVTVASILNHSTSMQWPSALEFMLMPVAERPDVRSLGAELGHQPCYSEIAGWLVLQVLIEDLTGVVCADYVRERISEPLGIASEVVLHGGQLPRLVAEDRVVAPLAGLPSASIPLLHVFAPAYWERMSPALGGLASARAVGTFTSALIGCLAGEPVNGLPEPATMLRIYLAGRNLRYDPSWRRRCAFALGFEYSRDWSRHGDQRQLLYLTSYLTTAMVVADTESNEGFALLLDGSSPRSEDLAHCREVALAHLGYQRHGR